MFAAPYFARLASVGNLTRYLLCTLTLCAVSLGANAQTCAAPGRDGATPTAGILNSYFAPASGTFNAASTAIAIGSRRGAAVNIAPGDLVVVMQMQCATLNTTNTNNYGAGAGTGRGYTDPAGSCLAGQYQYVRAGQGTTATSLDLTGSPLTGTYIQDASTATNRRTFQVLRVPQFASIALSGAVTPEYWDGASGGVVVLDVAGELNWNGQSVNAAGRGFRGAGAVNWPGTVDGDTPPDYVATLASTQHSTKAEGMAGTPRWVFNPVTSLRVDNGATWGGYANGDAGRGAPGNAGGGGNNRSGIRDNGGGGGGGNATVGGFGAYGWKSGGWAGTFTVADFDLRGIGGAAFASPAPTRVVMGGGGGAGGNNNSGADPINSSGGAGGGVVIVRAGSMSGVGTINVDGAAGRTNTANDGAGGGGAGGSAVIYSAAGPLGVLTVNANGGAGGNSFLAGDSAHAGGGGGAAGVVLRSGAATVVAAGGAAGTTNLNGNPPGGATHGATSGGGVIDATPADASVPNGANCLPNLNVTKTSLTPTITAAGLTQASYTIVVSNTGGAALGADIVDNTLPPGWTFAQSTALQFSPSLSATVWGGFVEGATPGLPAVANAPGAIANLSVNGAPAAAPVWSNLTIPGAVSGVPGRVTLSFVVNIPSTAAVGCYHNPAGVKYLDPTRSTAGREVTPQTNNTANRAGAQVGGTANTAYQTAPGTSTVVVGSNYSGLSAGPTTDDVCLQGDLSITKTGPAAATAGATITYTLTTRNNGREVRDLTYAADQATDAANANAGTRVLANGTVRVVDTLPVGLTLTTLPTPAGWSCTASGQILTCDRVAPQVPVAATTTLPVITATVRIGSSACAGPITNTATVAGFQTPYADSTAGNNTATVPTTLNCSANLSVTKTNALTSLSAGATTSYTVTYSNTGPASADNALVSDTPSPGLSCTVASCNASGGNPVASCPANPSALLGAGVVLPSLPSGGNVAFVVSCGVTATGQ